MDFNFKNELENVTNVQKDRNISGCQAEKFLKRVISEIKTSKELIFKNSRVIKKISFCIMFDNTVNCVTAAWLTKKDTEIGVTWGEFNFKSEKDASNFSRALKEKLKKDGFNIVDLPKPPTYNGFYETFYIGI